MDNSDNLIISRWQEIKQMLIAVEFDIIKNAKGNASAGVRSRRGLRLIRKHALELVKLTLLLDKRYKR
jgi:hypothetical protein